jgi:hypothetical protein
MLPVSKYQWPRIMIVCCRRESVKLYSWISERYVEMKIKFERLEGIGDPL